ncbi:MAG: hypothetical protein ACPHX5_01090 [Flavobacteriaceae bacterium]
MKKEEFLSLLNNKKAARNTAEISALKQMIEAYPYMQNVWALYLKGIDIDKDEAFESALKKTAIRTNDRALLFDYINTPEEIETEVAVEQHTAANNTVEENKVEFTESNQPEESKEEQSTESFVNELINSAATDDLSLSEEIEETEETETTPAEIPDQNISFGEEKNTFSTRAEKLDIDANDTVLEEILQTTEDEHSDLAQTTDDLEEVTEEEKKVDDTAKAQSKEIEEETVLAEDHEAEEDEDFNAKIRRLEVIINEMSFDEKKIDAEQIIQAEIEVETESAEASASEEVQSEKIEETTVPMASDSIEEDKAEEETEAPQLNYFEWIKQSTKKDVMVSNALETEEQERKFALLDAFLESNPKIVPSDEIQKIDIEAASSIEDESLITETMAQLYMNQKQFKKAITAYKALILKYPEKSSFFAIQIQEAQGFLDKQIDTE